MTGVWSTASARPARLSTRRWRPPGSSPPTRRSRCVKPSTPSITGCRWIWRAARCSRSRPTTAWFRPRTAAKASPALTKSASRSSRDARPGPITTTPQLGGDRVRHDRIAQDAVMAAAAKPVDKEVADRATVARGEHCRAEIKRRQPSGRKIGNQGLIFELAKSGVGAKTRRHRQHDNQRALAAAVGGFDKIAANRLQQRQRSRREVQRVKPAPFRTSRKHGAQPRRHREPDERPQIREAGGDRTVAGVGQKIFVAQHLRRVIVERLTMTGIERNLWLPAQAAARLKKIAALERVRPGGRSDQRRVLA